MSKYFLLIFSLVSIVSCQHKEVASTSGGYIASQKIVYPRESAEATGHKYIISTQGIASSKIAEDILKKGGNLIDAFVAASFAISVERPQSTGLGGGGFLVYHDGKSKKTYAVDFRERAPYKSTRDMYIDLQGHALMQLSQNGALAAGTPGVVKGLWEVHNKFGHLPWKEVVKPAIELARNGFEIYEELYKALESKKDVLIQDADAKRIFLDKRGQPLPKGHLLKQADLAKTLEKIAANGADIFYKGSIAQSISNFSKDHKGILSKKDLADYKVQWREPVHGEFLGYQIYSMPPPSSGGVLVYQFLKMLENENFKQKDINTAEDIHIEAAALQSAFADRAVHLGDPDFYKVPMKELTDPSYIHSRREAIKPAQARKMNEVEAGNFEYTPESTDTTHMSMMDEDGNAVSSTQTINGWMGAGVVVTGTGILLNNEMDDFSIQPGTANLYGAIGGKANEIQPLKTPLSSMSPTIILDKMGNPIMSVGAPGGTTIISCTAKTIYNYLFYKMPLWESVTNIRVHHQWSPDRLLIEEPGPGDKELKKLRDYGYEIKLQPLICKVMATARNGDELVGVADPRDIGTSRGN
jgi:gamma-glutamyltranspeptidase/glutathione hydrolase